MAIPKIKEQDIIDALKYIDENGVPFHNQSTKYALVTEDGKKYPPKYVMAVAAHIASRADISTAGFNAVEAKNYLQGQGFTIETKQEKFDLTISAESIVSTDERFTMDNLSLGDNYKPLGACFRKADGEEIKRAYSKGEKRNSKGRRIYTGVTFLLFHLLQSIRLDRYVESISFTRNSRSWMERSCFRWNRRIRNS